MPEMSPPPDLPPDRPLPVAVIGAALRFPGANDLDSYWQLLTSGQDAIRPPPAGRFDGMETTAPHLLAGYLDEIARFDNRFFGIPTDEARHMDPQQRLLLEVAFDAMLHAGLDVTAWAGRRVGLFLGLAKNAYGEIPGDPSPFTATGGQVSCAAGRIAYHFGFRGPAITLDTACSSALTAAHLALRSLRAGECELALIGGSNLILSPDGHAVFAALGLLAPDGRSRPFEEGAAGFGRGEGCAIAVLRRADLAQGDRSLGLIEGSAINHDGFSAGLTAPNQTAQVEVIRAALAEAGVSPDQIGLVETHGTGTALGDAIEARALTQVFAPGRSAANRLVIGSAKAVVGHLEHAAGMAGLLKALLCLEHGHIPGQPGFGSPTRHLPWERMAIEPAAQPRDWPALPGPRRAGLSAFGISGTNVHLVLRAADPQPDPGPVTLDSPCLLPLSARSDQALRRSAAALHTQLSGGSPLAAVARALATRRPALAHRAAPLVSDTASAVEALAALAAGTEGKSMPRGRADAPARAVFVFAGQGAQWPGMGRALLDHSPVFARTIARIEAALAPHVDWSLTEILRAKDAPLDRVEVVQPALFAMQVGLAQLWRHLGLEPVAVIGHSMGEIAAAAVAGALSLEEATRAVAIRATLIAQMARGSGAMASVELTAAEAADLLPRVSPDLSIAAFNAPRALVISGRPEGIDKLIDVVQAMDRFARRIEVDYASHSPLMAPLAAPLAEALADLAPRVPEIPLFSTVTGDFLDEAEFDGAYLARNLCRPVRFAQGIAALLDEGATVLIEVGAHPVLLHDLTQAAASARLPAVALGTLGRDRGGWEEILANAGRAWAAGCPLRWELLAPAAPWIDLPLYPWEGEPLWLAPPRPPAARLESEPGVPFWTLDWEDAPPDPADLLAAAEQKPRPIALLGFEPAEQARLEAAFQAEGDGLVAPEAATMLVLALAAAPDPLESGLYALDAWLRAERTPPQLRIVTRQAPGAPLLTPEQAALVAFARSAAAERPDVSIRCFHLDRLTADTARLLAREARQEHGPALVALTGGRRRVERFGPIPPAAPEPLDFSRPGVHLVTGGTSGIGRESALVLARRGAREIALLSRTPLAEADPLLSALAEAGSHPCHYCCDVADPVALAAILDQIRAAQGPIRGLIHAAGTSGQALLADSDRAALEAVLGPKLRGALALVRLTEADAPEYRLFHSSTAGLFRSPGQASYAAANAGLDALARGLAAQGQRAVSLLWPIWKDTGRAAREGFTPDTAFLALSREEGRAALARALDQTLPQIIAAQPNRRDPALARGLLDAPFRLESSLRRQLEAVALVPVAPRPSDQTDPILSGRGDGGYSPTERLLGAVYAELLGFAPIGVQENFFALGGNSILAARIVNRLKRDHPDLAVTVVDVLGRPTLAELAATVAERRRPNQTVPLPPAPMADSYPASAEQRRFWMQHQMERQASLFNLTGAYWVEPEIETARLDRTLRQLVERHEPLRTRFRLEQGALRQCPGPVPDSLLICTDLSAAPDPEEAARRLVQSEAARPFDLEQDLPLRAGLLTLGDRRILWLCLHHIAGDGWGLGVFTAEMAQILAAARAGTEPALAPLPVRYADYAVWQAARLTSPEATQQRAAWRQRLAGRLPVLALDTDFPRPPRRRGEGRKVSFQLEPDLSAVLTALSRQQGVTPSMLFLALIATLLHRLTGQSDLIIGLPTAGRDHPALEGMVGNFLNLLPIRLSLTPGDRFEALLTQGRERMVEAFANALIPFDVMIEGLDVPRLPGRTPVFDVMLLFQNHREADLAPCGLSPFLRVQEHSKVDLAFEVRENADGFEVAVEYDTALFRPERIDSLWADFRALAASAAARPEDSLWELALAPSAEAEARAVAFNAPLCPEPEQSPLARFLAQVERQPEAIALEVGERRWTYRALADLAEAWAALLPEANGKIVAASFGNDPRQLLALLGSWIAGGIYLPLDPAAPPARRAGLLALTRPVVCAVPDADQAEALALPPDCALLVAGADLVPHRLDGTVALARPDRPLPGPADDSYVFATSGSSGEPKAVLGRHGSLDRFLRWQGEEFGLNAPRLGFLIGFTFDASLRDLLLPLILGGTLVVPVAGEREDLGQMARFIARARLTVLHSVPSVLRPLTAELGRLGPDPVPALTHLFLSGEPLYAEDLRRWRAACGPAAECVNFYGSTETTLISCFHRIEADPPAVIPAGRPRAETRVAVVAGRHPCRLGQIGEILIKTPHATKGYLGRPDLTAAAFVQNPLQEAPDLVFRSGDLGRIDTNGRLEVLGRADSMIKLAGIRVELGEIEQALLCLPEIVEAAVSLTPGDPPVLTAHLVRAARAAWPDLRTALAATLPASLIPTRLLELPSLPRLPSGKVNRAALGDGSPIVAPTAPAAAESDRRPGSDIEQTLALLWGEVLGRQDFGPEDHFLDLGGSSLNAMTLLPRLARAFGIEVRFSDFMAHATLAGLARLIGRQGGTKARPRLLRQPDAPSYPVSHAQQRMWLLQSMDGARGTFTIKRAWDLTGTLDPGALQQALTGLIRRHESLRTRFAMAAGGLSQQIDPAATAQADFAQTDLSERGAEAETEARDKIESWFERPFDLETGPLLRGHLLKLAADRWVFALAIHHIVADGWSMVRLEQDLIRLYNARVRQDSEREESGLPPLPVHYRDFAMWQNALLAGEALAPDRAYWQRQLAGNLPVLELPLDAPRPAVRRSHGGHETDRLPLALVERLRALGRSRDASLFMVAAAALSVLLSRLSGQSEIMLGTAVAGRDDPDIEAQIGFYVNALALRIPVPAEAGFAALLDQVRTTTIEAYEHQAYPFDQLVDDLDLRRDLARIPVFEAAIQLLHRDFGGDAGAETPDGLTARRFKIRSRTAQFDLSLFLREEEQGLFLIAEYNRDLFRPETIRRWLGAYRRLLEAVAEDPACPVGDLDLLAAEEQAAVIAAESGPLMALPVRTIHGLFEASAAAYPDLPAVILGDHAVSYGALDRSANQIAQALRQAGVNWDGVVGLLLDRSPDFFAGLVGSLKAGAAFLPLDPQSPPDRLRYMLRDAGATALITSAAALGLARRLQWDCPGLDLLIVPDCDHPDLQKEAAGEVMSRDLWEEVGQRAEDDIQAGGWRSSYTGQPFSRAEMDEYADNALAKIAPLLTPASRVLEIGCSSGLTLKRVAPLCAEIVGIDLSGAILARTRADCDALGLTNVTLRRMAADEIDTLAALAPFDLVVINSVIQAFPGHGYLRAVLGKALALMGERSHLFLGDLQDLDRREALVADLLAFRRAHPEAGKRAKTDVSAELFLSRAFFQDLLHELPGLTAVECSDKTGSIANELTRFRFDAVLRFDRAAPAPAGAPVKRRIGRAALAALSAERPEPVTRPRDLAYILYTSGSTGRPKGVMVEHEGVALVGTYLRQIYHLTPGERIGQFFSQGFDGSVYEYVQAFAAAATLVVIDPDTRLDAERFLAVMQAAQVTVLTVAPAFLREIGAERFDFLRVLASGGEAPVPAMARLADQALVANCYGPTEASILAVHHFARPEEAEEPALPMGRPIPLMQALVLDGRGHRVPFGVTGELWLAGPGLARGYCNLPEETERRFRPLPVDPRRRAYRTGDLVRRRPDGTLEFRGRNDTQLSIRGIRIEAEEVESALRAVPGVQDALVMGVGPRPAEAALVAWLAGPDPIAPSEIATRLAETLPAFMIPSAWVWMERFPRLPSGKIDRRALPAPASSPSGPGPAPRDRLERDLAAAMAESLGLETFSREKDFFEAGGHSLKAMRFVSLIRSRHGHGLSLRDVFEAPTVAGLAAVLRARQSPPEPAAETGIPRLPDAPSFPLSPQQRRLWVLDRLDGADSAGLYTNPVTFRLPPGFDSAALEQALTQLAARHESLRTAIFDSPDGPRQRILERIEVRVGRYRVATEAEQERVLAAESARGFALDTPPLFRAVLVEGAPAGAVLLFDIHHIISDGWSLEVIARELNAFLAAHRRGIPARLPPLPIHYRDYAVWQAGRAEQGLAFWQTMLGEGSPPLDLPTDFPRPAVKSYAGATLRHDLPAPLTEALRAYARARGTGLFAVLLAIFTLLLARRSGQNDLTIGTPAAGRDHPALAGQIGFFVNTLALRRQLVPGDSFDSLVAAIRHDLMAALEHQDTPFDLLVERLAPPRDLSRAPFFDVLMALHDAVPQDTALAGVGAPQSRETGTAKFDLSFRFIDHGDRLSLAAEYRTDLFAEPRIRGLIAAFERLAAALLAQPARPVALAGDLAPEEEARLLAPGRSRPRPLPAQTLSALFAASVAAYPNHPAVTDADETLTYQALDRRAAGLANLLRQRGIGPETVIGVAAPRRIARIVALLAVAKAGAAYLPLEADQPAARIAFLIRDAGARLVLTDGSLPLPAGLETLPIPTEAEEESVAIPPPPAEALAYVLYTSGSSGPPKGVTTTQANVCALAWAPDYAPLGPGDSVLHFAPFGFDAATFEICGALLNGARLVLAPEGEPDLARLATFVRQEQISVLWLTAGLFATAVSSQPDLFDGLRCLLAGGDRVPPATVRALLQRRPDLALVNGYGPTETTTFACTHPISAADADSSSIPIGTALAESRVVLLDPLLRPVAEGTPGEIWIVGPGLARGYLRAPALTAERFIACPFGTPGERMYRSGDLGRRRPDGRIEFLGRIDQQLKLNGFRVEPGEVEAALQRRPQVARACAGGLELAAERRLVAWVVPAVAPTDRAAFARQLRAELAAEVPAPLVPAVIGIVDSLPLTANGKVDRSRLPRPVFASAQTGARPPASEAERLLCRLFADLTGADSVSVEDNFFALGGHSLLAMRLVAQIRAALGLELPLRAVFEAPTPAALAARLGRDRIAGPARPPLLASPRSGRVPASHAQRRLWFIDQLQGTSVEYNMPEALRLTGPLNRAALEQALARLVARHETLRTRFVVEAGQPLQEILPSLALPLPLTDWSDRSEAEQQAKLDEAMASEWQSPFDLATGPLLRARLLRLGGESHVLLRTCHHIISDGWSGGVINHELAVLYEAFAAGLEDPLPPLPVHYADFAAWQSAWLESGALDQGLVWWREALAGRPERLTLPTDRPRPPLQTYAAERTHGRIAADTATAARALAAAQGATLFQVMLAAFALVLGRDARQDDIVIGTAVANRQDPQLDGLIGFFVNALAMRVRIEPGDDFTALVRRTRDYALAAYQHQDVPFEKLVEDLAPDRSLAYTPIFQVSFNLQNAATGRQDLHGLAITPLPSRTPQVRFDLEIHAIEQEDGLELIWLYNRDLFDAARIESLLARFLAVLSEGVTAPATPLPRLARAQALPVSEFRPAPCPPTTLLSLHERAPWSGQPAVISGAESLSRAALATDSNRLAHWLIAQGAGPEQVIGLALPRGCRLVVAILAVLKAGAAWLPLDPSLPEARRAAMEAEARPHLILEAAGLEALDLSGFPADPPESRATPDNPAYVIFTSGSTGRPKGVMVPHRALAALALDQRTALGLGPDDRILQFASSQFDASVWEIALSFASGATLVIAAEEQRSGPALLALLRDQNVTHALLPPALLASLEPPEQALPLRILVSGGETLPAEVAERWGQGRTLLNAYGPTEITVLATQTQPEQGESPLSLGRPIAGARVYVLDPSLAPVPVGMPGELWIGGEGLARGYVGRPGLTAERFVADPYGQPGARMYRTGDLAAWRRDGTLDFLGRVDHQIKVRGFRIEPGEIEAALRRHPRVSDALVLKRGEGAEAGLIGYIVPDVAPAVCREADRAAYVAYWQSLYESTYGESPGGDFDISGWNASDDGAPIPAAEMMSWVCQTVSRIAALPGADVLEIGCGSGLLLTRIAPDRRSYLGLDFSAEALERLRATVSARPDLAGKVTLRQGEACDLSALADASVDLVVINSVVQYFPDLDYLLAVIRESLRVCRPGGHLFLGDLRSLVLLPALHSWVTLQRADPTAPAAPLAAQIAQAVADEEELTLDPALFEALADLYPGLSRVELAPKLGGYDNELSRYRYDVTLALGPVRQSLVEPEIRIAATPDWPQRLAAAGTAAPVGVEGGPDPRGAWTRIAADLCPGFPGSVAALRAEAEARAAAEAGLTADLLAAAGGPIVWRGVGTGRLEAIYHPRWVEREPPAEMPDLTLYANQPARRMGQADLGREVQDHLRTLLPEPMIPAPILVVPHWPLTPSGKIDRKALPAPEARAASNPPVTATEQRLARLWEELLQGTPPSREDNFFALGGHSLLATRLVSRIRQEFGLDLPLRRVFDQPRLDGLAAAIEAATLSPAAAPARPPLIARPRSGPVPASHAQRRLWFLDQLQGASVEYNMPEALRLTGPLDLPALDRAVARLVARHESLRTRFIVENGMPMQEILPQLDLPLPISDWSALDEAEQQSRIEAARAEEGQHRFDLAHGPLLRLRLLRLGAESHILLRTCHHIISDGWSAGVINRELTALYAAFAAGDDDPLPPLPVHYADFTAWQNDWLESGALDRGLSWWRSALADRPDRLALPTDRPRPPVQTYQAEVVRGRLDAETTEAARTLAHQHGATLFQVMLAAFALVLSRDARQNDLVIGTVVANRQETQLEGLIGFFVNALALRLRIAPEADFAALVRQARDYTLAAYQHQDVPFEKLVEDLAPDRSLAHPPIFQVAFTLLNTDFEPQTLAGLEISALPGGPRRVRFDLEAHAIEQQDGIELIWLYNRDLFEAARIEAMLGRFLAVLAAGVRAPATPLPLLAQPAAAQRRQLALAFNPPRHPDPFTPLAALQSEIARHHPDQPAVIFGSVVLSHAELEARSSRLAHWLLSQGAGPEQVVGIALPRGLDLTVAVLAVLQAGAAWLPLDPDLPEARRAAMIEDARPLLVLTPALLADLDWSALPETPPPLVPAPAHPAYVLFTSGSTGRPKGVVIPQAALLNRILWMQRAWPIGPGERVMQKTPFGFDVSVWEFVWPLITGAAQVMAPPGLHRDPDALASAIQAQEVTIVHFVPSMLAAFLESPAAAGCTSLRRVLASGEALTAPQVARFRTIFPGVALHNLYGPTEAAIDVTAWRCGLADTHTAPPIGRPIDNLRLYVLDPVLTPLSPGLPGELWIAGAGLARGYSRQPGLTAERFLADPFGPPGERMYRTGDLGMWRADGSLDYLGRVDQQVKIRGVRIEPGEIEAALSSHLAVAEAAVVVRSGPDGAPMLAAYLVPDPVIAPELHRLAELDAWGDLPADGLGLLPNGMVVCRQNAAETDFLYRELFEEGAYLDVAAALPEDACLFDVGANIGLFTLQAARLVPNARIFAFEPIPAVFESLRRNVAIHCPQARIFNCALGAARGEASFTWYPGNSILSGRYADAGEEAAVVAASLRHHALASDDDESLRAVIDQRLHGQTVVCPIRTLSEIIAAEQITRLDLLKIDVEKAEQDVLDGLNAEDWPKVQRIVVEVHDRDGRLDQICTLLHQHGFQVRVSQDSDLVGTAISSVEGWRDGVGTGTRPVVSIPSWPGPESLRAALRQHLAGRVPDYMIPPSMTLLPALPLSANGKLDRAALPAPDRPSQCYSPPRTPQEVAVCTIVADLLGLERVGRDESFFALGGHSLLATRLVSRLRDRLGIELALQDIFASPILADLAMLLAAAGGGAAATDTTDVLESFDL